MMRLKIVYKQIGREVGFLGFPAKTDKFLECFEKRKNAEIVWKETERGAGVEACRIYTGDKTPQR